MGVQWQETDACAQWRPMTNVQSSEIDLAIITALKIERKAICQHLEDLEVVQDTNDPYTYYRGRLATASGDEHYEVAVIQLAGMGNDEAAIHTAALIARWHPHSVLMVGIAGGVRGKVQLGDVVVADAVYYYELAKVTTQGGERRPQEFRSDRLLYNRAQAYEESDWKARIGVARPKARETVEAQPEVHFGHIAAGEKVVADGATIADLVRAQPQVRAVAMEGAGVARAASQQPTPPRFLEIRGICDFGDAEKNDEWQPYAAATVAAFTVGIWRSRPVLPAVGAVAHANPPRLMVLQAQSLRPINPQEIAPALREIGVQAFEPVVLDLMDLVAADRLTDPAAAARRLTDPRGRLFAALARRKRTELAFHGLVHIPLAVLAGYLVTDRQPVRLFDYHPGPAAEGWRWPSHEDAGPPWTPTRIPAAPARGDVVAVVRMSVSYAVTVPQTHAVIPTPCIEVDLTVPEPRRNVVTSEAQVRRYGMVFRSELDRLVRVAPGLERIHLFYAGPVALAFHVGQLISANIHPPVTVWNFRQGSYEWGLDLTAAAMQSATMITTADDALRPVLAAAHEEELA